MISISKSTSDPNISVYKHNRWKGLDGKKTTLANRDLQKAIAYYGDSTKFNNNQKLTNEKSIKYEAYSHKDTKEVLKEVFHSKCAYCESYIAHIEPGDVEHFRPKAKVVTDQGNSLIPGYYWLGASWNNLLLSCINCNRPNRLLINSTTDEVLMGKANFFPISDESKRLRNHHQDIALEAPFVELINPCSDNPEQHLDFLANGEVRALDEKGEKSIAIYGLYRADLVLRRKKTAEGLNRTLEFLVMEIKDIQEKQAHGMPIDLSLDKLVMHLESLKKALEEKAEYLAIKKALIAQFIASNPISNNKLVDLGVDLTDLL